MAAERSALEVELEGHVHWSRRPQHAGLAVCVSPWSAEYLYLVNIGLGLGTAQNTEAGDPERGRRRVSRVSHDAHSHESRRVSHHLKEKKIYIYICHA